eukprot:Awhi_evm1s5189
MDRYLNINKQADKTIHKRLGRPRKATQLINQSINTKNNTNDHDNGNANNGNDPLVEKKIVIKSKRATQVQPSTYITEGNKLAGVNVLK